MLGMVLKDLLGARRARSALCILVVMVSAHLNGTVLVMNDWMQEARISELVWHMTDRICVRQSGTADYPPLDSSISQETVEAILARDDLGVNVAESTPMIFVRIEHDVMPFIPSELVIGVPVGKERILLSRAKAAEGVSRFDTGERGDVAILGGTTAQSLGASVGQDIMINGRAVRVIGILERSNMNSVNIAAVMPLEAVQRIFDKEGVISVAVLKPGNVEKMAEIASAIRRDYPLLRTLTLDEMLAESQQTIRAPMMYMNTMRVMGVIGAIAVIMSTMFMAVVERTREFGTLHAIGARRRLILGLVLTEALLLAMIGGLPGAGLSLLMMDQVMGAPLPGAARLLQIIGQIIGLVVAAAVLGGICPAWRAARMDPVEALRYE